MINNDHVLKKVFNQWLKPVIKRIIKDCCEKFKRKFTRENLERKTNYINSGGEYTTWL